MSKDHQLNNASFLAERSTYGDSIMPQAHDDAMQNTLNMAGGNENGNG